METKQSLEFKLNQLDARSVDVPQTFNGAITSTAGATFTGGLTAITGTVHLVLPTSDPAIAGVLWNNVGTITVSAG